MSKNTPIGLADTLLKPGEIDSQAAEYGARIPPDIWLLVRRLKQHFAQKREESA
jgi:hypothetical protein